MPYKLTPPNPQVVDLRAFQCGQGTRQEGDLMTLKRTCVIAVLASTGLVAAAVPAAADVVPASEPTQDVCASREFILLFWPQGHPALPAAGFPPYPPPHVEVYTTGLTADAFAGYAEAGPAVAFGVPCQGQQQTPGVPVTKPKKAKATRETATLRCRLKKNGRMQLDPPAGDDVATVSILESKKRFVATAAVGASGSVLRFNKRVCKVIELPELQA